MRVSIFNDVIGPVMRGPSSSHCAAALRIGRLARDLMAGAGDLDYIESGQSEGAKLVLGGGRTLQKTGGFFVEPTIFDQVKPSMRIAREEIFGPVLSVFAFDKEEDGIALANDTNYGLTASVYTQDVNRAHRVARALRAGTVSVNCFSEGDATTPFGGFKQSGFFGRDKSIFAHYQYTELKTIWMQLT